MVKVFRIVKPVRLSVIQGYCSFSNIFCKFNKKTTPCKKTTLKLLKMCHPLTTWTNMLEKSMMFD